VKRCRAGRTGSAKPIGQHGVASNEDASQPDAKDRPREAFAAAQPVYRQPGAERTRGKLVELYLRAPYPPAAGRAARVREHMAPVSTNPRPNRLNLMVRLYLRLRSLGLPALGLLVLAGAGSAAVRSVEIAERTPVLDGSYERIVGRVHFGMNPALVANRIVRDLELAQLNAAGEAESAADFYILEPAGVAKGNGTVLFEVSNRGGKAMLNRFNFASGSSDFGDEWAMKQGFTLVWLGWEWDIPASNRTALHFTAPHHRPDAPSDGLVRAEFTPEKTATVMPLGDRGQDAIPVGKPVAMYMRSGTDAAPRQIPVARRRRPARRAPGPTIRGFRLPSATPAATSI
jgi:hypothetical protein